jgi:hypothetical protein
MTLDRLRTKSEEGHTAIVSFPKGRSFVTEVEPDVRRAGFDLCWDAQLHSACAFFHCYLPSSFAWVELWD